MLTFEISFTFFLNNIFQINFQNILFYYIQEKNTELKMIVLTSKIE
jgi:hypothetical protein